MFTETDKKYYTPEEYRVLEEQADYKSEYRDGEIVPMTGEATHQNELALTLAALLKLKRRTQNYRVYMGNVRLWIPRDRQYTSPDVMVIGGEPIYTDTGTTTVTNPLLMAEVLSKCTENYDQGDKFMYYRSIPEMWEYSLIEQTRFYVIQYYKIEKHNWMLTEWESEAAGVRLKLVHFELSLGELYEGVEFKG
ncbi:Uma2 family endonuclease [Oscillatoria sp. HE19RPO]|uniref:Uma2 family endonuclease n=1 Tax=Oscillatoria sp. HE19RPO TaxID=2954806 RepID=UPI0020C1C6DA|nr:Uma2 family endonuclease [Oscillatoria sp. HE19RPO]